MKHSELHKHLKNAGVIVYPTDTLWGLGADATQAEAVNKVFEVKDRATTKALSLVVADVKMAESYAYISDSTAKLLNKYWPGALTAVVPAKENVLSEIHGGTGHVGLRCTTHQELQEFIKDYGAPITTTSANRSGEPSPRSKADLNWLPESILLADMAEPLGGSKGSTVIRIIDDQLEILREGDIPSEELQKAWQEITNSN